MTALRLEEGGAEGSTNLQEPHGEEQGHRTFVIIRELQAVKIPHPCIKAMNQCINELAAHAAVHLRAGKELLMGFFGWNEVFENILKT